MFRIDVDPDLVPEAFALRLCIYRHLGSGSLFEHYAKMIVKGMDHSSRDLLSQELPRDLSAFFQHYLLETALTRAAELDAQFQRLGSFGELRHYWLAALLSCLDKHLLPKELSRRGLPSLLALYLVLGVLMAVLASEQARSPDGNLAADRAGSESGIVLQTIIWQLVQRLDLLGSRLGLQSVGQILIEVAKSLPS